MPTDLWYLDASAVVKLVMPEQGAETFRLATARLLGPALAGIVTYDLRLAEAAAHQGIVTVSP